MTHFSWLFGFPQVPLDGVAYGSYGVHFFLCHVVSAYGACCSDDDMGSFASRATWGDFKLQVVCGFVGDCSRVGVVWLFFLSSWVSSAGVEDDV